MRRLIAALLALGLFVPALVEVRQAQGQTQQGRRLETYVVTCPASTPTNVVGHNSSRVSMTVLNVGTTHASVGQSVTIRPFTLHAGATLTLDNYVGSLDCLASGSVQLQVLEEVR